MMSWSRSNLWLSALLLSVKVHDLLNIRELTAIIELEEDSQTNGACSTDRPVTFRSLKSSCQLQWSDDGQLMAVATPRQLLHVFLSQLPMLASVAQSKTSHLSARLSSLLEVTLEPLPFNHVSHLSFACQGSC